MSTSIDYCGGCYSVHRSLFNFSPLFVFVVSLGVGSERILIVCSSIGNVRQREIAQLNTDISFGV
jgi:S-adenosylmethionine hydrolase